MSLGTLIQIFLDLILLLGLGYCLLRLNNEDRWVRDGAARIKELTALRDSLRETIREALRVSQRIGEDIQAKKKLADEMALLLQEEKTSGDAARGPTGSGSPRPGEAAASPPASPRILKQVDKYGEVVRLASHGLTAGEISKRLDLPVGEVELALNLRK